MGRSMVLALLVIWKPFGIVVSYDHREKTKAIYKVFEQCIKKKKLAIERKKIGLLFLFVANIICDCGK